MNPYLSTYEVTYWVCHNPEHRHKTEAIALACIGRFKNTGKRDEHYFRNAEYRRLLATLAVINGASLSEAGKSVGVSGGRVAGMVRDTFSKMRRNGFDTPRVSVPEARKQAEKIIPQINAYAKKKGHDLWP